VTLLHLVRGDDPTLRVGVVQALVEDLLAGEDRTLALEDHTIPGRRAAGSDAEGEAGADAGSVDQPVFRQVVNALDSPPFMTSRRVVVVRDVGNLTADQVDVLVAWLAQPVETTALVLVAGGGRLSTRLTKALGAAGGQTHTPASESARDRVAEQLAISLDEHGIRLDKEAAARVGAHVGDDAGRLPELVDLLHSTYGDGAVLDLAAVEPYLGEAGTAARYELTNAIDSGDGAAALDVLRRLLRATSGRQKDPLHPLQIMMTLQFHYRDLLRLDDPAITTKEQAAEAIGQRSPWAAKHRLDASRRLGSEGLRDALRLLARADVDLRGGSGLPEDVVMEVLVARLAALGARTAPARRARR
jgi:DNA polymerase-3 subunit delta